MPNPINLFNGGNMPLAKPATTKLPTVSIPIDAIKISAANVAVNTPLPIGGNQISATLSDIPVNLPVTDNSIPLKDIVPAEPKQTNQQSKGLILAPNYKEIKKMFEAMEEQDLIEESEIYDLIKYFKKLPIDLQREIVDNPKSFTKDGEEVGYFYSSLLRYDNAATLLKNYRTIISGIEYSRFKDENGWSEFYDDEYYDYLLKPEVLSQNPQLITNLINEKKDFELNLFKHGLNQEGYDALEKKGIFSPELRKAFNNIEFENRAFLFPFFDIEIFNEFLALPKEKIESIFKFINSKNLRYFLNSKEDLQLLIDVTDKFSAYFEKRGQEPTHKELIISKLLLTNPKNYKKNINKFPEIAAFYEKHYGKELDKILADPNFDIYSFNPRKYKIPEISDISDGVAKIKAESPDSRAFDGFSRFFFGVDE